MTKGVRVLGGRLAVCDVRVQPWWQHHRPDASGYALGDEAGVETLKFWRGLVEKGCAKQATEAYGLTRRTSNGFSLFTVSSISGLPYYGTAVSEGAGFGREVNPPPHSTAEPRMNIYGASQSIFVSTPEEQLAAWLSNKYLSEPEQQATWASSTGYFDARLQRIC